jgi:hypothetical protein
VIEVREVSLDGVEVTLEQAHAGSNYDAIVSKLGTGQPSAPPKDRACAYATSGCERSPRTCASRRRLR